MVTFEQTHPKVPTAPRELPKCTLEQSLQFWAEARAFINATGFYSSMKWDAECAVAEYIAYQAGYTIR